MFDITFSINKSPINKLYKDLQIVATLSGELRQQTSILTPTIQIEITPNTTLNAVTTANYCYIESFNQRKYFIEEWEIVNANILQFTARVDVLSTYADIIKQQKAIIKRQENLWNLYLNDGSFKIFQNPNILTKAFPSGFYTDEYVLSIAGK